MLQKQRNWRSQHDILPQKWLFCDCKNFAKKNKYCKKNVNNKRKTSKFLIGQQQAQRKERGKEGTKKQNKKQPNRYQTQNISSWLIKQYITFFFFSCLYVFVFARYWDYIDDIAMLKFHCSTVFVPFCGFRCAAVWKSEKVYIKKNFHGTEGWAHVLWILLCAKVNDTISDRPEKSTTSKIEQKLFIVRVSINQRHWIACDRLIVATGPLVEHMQFSTNSNVIMGRELFRHNWLIECVDRECEILIRIEQHRSAISNNQRKLYFVHPFGVSFLRLPAMPLYFNTAWLSVPQNDCDFKSFVFG